MWLNKFLLALLLSISAQAMDEAPVKLNVKCTSEDFSGIYHRQTVYPQRVGKRRGLYSPMHRDGTAWGNGFGFLFRDIRGYWHLYHSDSVYRSEHDGFFYIQRPEDRAFKLGFSSISNELTLPPTNPLEWKVQAGVDADLPLIFYPAKK